MIHFYTYNYDEQFKHFISLSHVCMIKHNKLSQVYYEAQNIDEQSRESLHFKPDMKYIVFQR